MNNHKSCRTLLKDVMKDVRKAVPAEQIKAAWGNRSKTKMFFKNHVEFHGPNDFYWHDLGCCVWRAKAHGWRAYLRRIGFYNA